MPTPPTLDEIRSVVQKAVQMFAASNIKCCLFGDAACAQYGASRCPNDVDLIVLAPGSDSEAIKVQLTQWDSAFYLVHARNPLVDYSTLWHRLAPLSGASRRCSVEILVSDISDIPIIPPKRIVMIGGLPLMPLIPLLLFKLQGWVAHRESDHLNDWAKEHVDVADIAELLQIARRRGDRVGKDGLDWLPEEFVELSRDRVRQYVSSSEQTESAWYWQLLGFEV